MSLTATPDRFTSPPDERELAATTVALALFTSHSPTVVEELGARYLHTVRNNTGEVTITAVPGELTPVVRANATALLSKRVIVADGKTEIGLLGARDGPWAAEHDGRTLAFKGVAVVDGGGASAPERAQRLHCLGYPTLFFADTARQSTWRPSSYARTA